MSIISLLSLLLQLSWSFTQLKTMENFSFPPFNIILLLSQDDLMFNPLNAELNPICHFLALLGAHHILHVSRIRVKMANSVQTPKIPE
jgi:hypothetical protein